MGSCAAWGGEAEFNGVVKAMRSLGQPMQFEFAWADAWAEIEPRLTQDCEVLHYAGRTGIEADEGGQRSSS